jgi:hypothetical protein
MNADSGRIVALNRRLSAFIGGQISSFREACFQPNFRSAPKHIASEPNKTKKGDRAAASSDTSDEIFRSRLQAGARKSIPSRER